MTTTSGISMSAFGAGSNGTLGTGIDVTATVNALMSIQRKPEDNMKAQQSTNNQMITALQAMNTQLSTLNDSVIELGDFVSGAFSQISVGSSDSGVVTATADTSAVTGPHSITVTQIATTSSTYADPISATATLANGTFKFSVGGVAKSIDVTSSNNTLATLASSINADSTLGVTASVLQGSGGATLALVSKTSGLAGAVSVTTPPAVLTNQQQVDSDGNPVVDSNGNPVMVTNPLSFHEGTQAQDAKVVIDGVPFQQSTNTLEDVVPGLTINLWSQAPGQTITLNVAPDTNTAATAIQNFVTSYNSMIKSVNSQFTVDVTTNTQGLLGSDSAIRTLQGSLLSLISYSTGNTDKYSSLASLGINMNNDGTLTVDSTKLSTALQSNFDGVKSFFQDVDKGFATNMKTAMLSLTSPTTGPLSVDITGLAAANKDLTNSIQDFEDRMTSVQQRLLDEYNKINATMQQFPSLMQSLSEQLTSLTPGK